MQRILRHYSYSITNFLLKVNCMFSKNQGKLKTQHHKKRRKMEKTKIFSQKTLVKNGKSGYSLKA